MFTDRRFIATEGLNYDICRFLPCSYYSLALRNLFKKRLKVCRLHHFKELVRCIVLESAYLAGRIIHGYAFGFGKACTSFLVESSGTLSRDEMISVTEEYQSHDSPHVIYEVRVEEVHRPTFLFGRETSQHENLRSFRKERLKRMMFYGS